MAIRLPRLLGIGNPTATQRWRLTRALFDQRGPVLLGSLSLLGATTAAWASSGNAALLAIGATNMAACGLRLSLLAQFRRDPDRHATPEAWAKRFAVGAFAIAVLWGLAATAVIHTHDGLATLLVLSIASGYGSASVVRNSPSPVIAIGQTGIIAAIVGAACLATGQWQYQVLAVLMLIQVAANVQISRFLSGQMRMLMEAERRQAELAQALDRLSSTDELTGIANRRGFEQGLMREWDRCARAGTPLALIIVDVDLFKLFNDTYGHPEGDICLRGVAQALAGAVNRPGDLVARFGGEEFAVLLPETDQAGALEIAERLRQAVDALAIGHVGSPFRRLTISAGLAVHTPGGGTPVGNAGALVEDADAALYRAKHDGRNRVAVAPRLAAASPG